MEPGTSMTVEKELKIGEKEFYNCRSFTKSYTTCKADVTLPRGTVIRRTQFGEYHADQMKFTNMRTSTGTECDEGRCYGNVYQPGAIYGFDLDRSISKFYFKEA